MTLSNSSGIPVTRFCDWTGNIDDLLLPPGPKSHGTTQLLHVLIT